MSEVKRIRNVSQSSADESLMLPGNLTLGIFNIENWTFHEMPLRGKQDYVFHVVAECKLDGYEDWSPEWFADEKDIQIFGNGDEQQWKQYVIGAFHNALETKKEQYLQKIKDGLGLAFGN